MRFEHPARRARKNKNAVGSPNAPVGRQRHRISERFILERAMRFEPPRPEGAKQECSGFDPKAEITASDTDVG